MRKTVCCLILVLLANLGISAGVFATDLVGDWNFDYGNLTDSSTFSNDGLIEGEGISFVDDADRGLVLHVNGGGYVRIPHIAAYEITDQLSVSCWFKSEPGATDWAAIIDKWTFRVIRPATMDTIGFSVKDSAGGDLAWLWDDTRNDFDGQWHNFIGIFAGSTCAYYIDGELISVKDISTEMGVRSDLSIRIGADVNNYGHFTGCIDDVKIYHGILNREQIKTLSEWQPSLIGFWDFDRLSDAGDPNDLLERNNATLEGAANIVFDSDRNNNVLSVDGTSGTFAKVPYTPDFNLTSEVTLNCWAKADPAQVKTWGNILTKWDTGYRLLVSGDPRYILATINCPVDGSSNLAYAYGTGITAFDNTWHMITMTYDGAKLRTYVDAQDAGSVTKTGAINKNNYSFYMGGATSGLSGFVGRLDDVQIYNGALTADQLLNVYNGLSYYSAANPSPADEAEGVYCDARLSWDEGPNGVVKYQLYLGTDQTVVADADETSDVYQGELIGRTNSFCKLAYLLTNNTTYFWRVDMVEDNGAVAKGGIWSFTTESGLPKIYAQPDTQTVVAGQDAEFAVKAFDADSYQWYKNGQALSDGGNVSGSNTSILTIAAAGSEDCGEYYCQLANSNGQIDSVAAKLAFKALVAHWSFDEGFGNEAYDYSVSGNDLQVNGPQWTTGIVNGALDFDGADDELISSNAAMNAIPLGDSGYTVCAWVNPDHILANKWQNVLSFGEGIAVDSPLKSFYFAINGNQIWHGWWGNDLACYDTAIQANQWQLLAATYDGKTRAVWLNGKMINSEEVIYDHQVATTENFTIGRIRPFTSHYFDGKIDEVKIYNYALSDKEIAQMYVDGAGGSIVLESKFDFDHDSDVDAEDLLEFLSGWLSDGLF